MRFWAAETTSLLGSEVSTVALPLAAVLVLHASAFDLGLLGAAKWAPYLLLALPAGLYADAVRRRPILIGTDLGQAFLLLCVPVLAVLGDLHLGWLLLVAFGTGGLAVFFEVAYHAYLPTIVGPGRLIRANSRLSMSESAAEIGGPGLGGVLVQIASAPAAVLADAVSFLVSAALLCSIRDQEPLPTRSRGRPSRDIAAGFRFMLGNPLLRAFAGEAATYNFWWLVLLTVLPLYVLRDLGMSSATLGVLLALGSAGALFGAAITEQVASRLGLGATIIGAAVIGDLAPLALPVVHGSSAAAVAVLGGALFIRGAGVTGCNVHVNAIRQTITPNEMLGRGNASYRFLVYGVMPGAALTGGFLGTVVGLRTTVLIATIGLLTTAAWLILSPVRQLTTHPHAPGTPAPHPVIEPCRR
jgi:MFS family permease